MERLGRLVMPPFSSSSLAERSSSSSSEEAGESDGGSLAESREKSSIEAGSDGEVMRSGDAWSGWRVVGVVSCLSVSTLLAFSKERWVGRLGVDLDWKPVGRGGGLIGG